MWILLGVVLVAGYALSWRLRRRIWRARQVSGTRHPDGYWWEGDAPTIARFVAVTMVGAVLIAVVTAAGSADGAPVRLGAHAAFVAFLLVALARHPSRPVS